MRLGLLLFSLLFGFAQADRLTPVIGATLMVGWPGTQISDPSTQLLCQQLSRGEIGGVLFLRHNMETAEQVSELTQYFARCGARFSPLLAVDQEGGLVDRLGNLPGETKWPSAEEIGLHPPGYAAEPYKAMAQRIRELGFNVNFGPVADLNTNPSNPIIGRLGRSYGAEQIGPILETFVAAHQGANVATALKHFPGHGSSTTDSHLGFTDISSTWHARELAPFIQAMEQTDAIMAGHLVNRALDETGLPATLSEPMLNQLLREGLGFSGVIVSDDMAMRAITDHYGLEASILMGLSAGIDLYVHSNSGPYDPNFVEQYHSVVRDAIEAGELTQDDLHQKSKRLAAWTTF